MTKLFVSDAIFQERLAITQPELSNPWGWAKLSSLYQSSFAACGYQIAPVTRPEIYQTAAAHKVLNIEAGDLHLAVKPIEHLRPFHGIPNVFVCNWSFSELSTRPRGDSPFFDQAHLLGLADAVLCCTDFTTQVLRNTGIDRAFTLPPVVQAPIHKERPNRDASIIEFSANIDNVYYRRNLDGLIGGFAQAARQNAALHLTINLQNHDAQNLSELRQRIGEDGRAISIFGPDDVAAPSAKPAFFLCADPAPGLCVPLIEAMLDGIPLVTTMTAGTASFLTLDAAVSIATQPQHLSADDEPIAGLLPLTANAATPDAICAAVLAATALSEHALEDMAATARRIAERQFNLPVFQDRLGQIGALFAREVP